MIEQIFYTDERIECYKSLELVCDELIKCNSNSYHWKWAIIGIHNALQNFMVVALKDGIGMNILKRADRNQFYKTILTKKFGSFAPDLNNFLRLYDGIKSDKMKRYCKSKPYTPEKNDDFIIEQLNDVRNFYMHFLPMGVTENVLDFLDYFFVSIKIINFLLNKSGNIIFEESERKYSNHLIEIILKTLESYKIIFTT